jgi:hypothetical protein
LYWWSIATSGAIQDRRRLNRNARSVLLQTASDDSLVFGLLFSASRQKVIGGGIQPVLEFPERPEAA